VAEVAEVAEATSPEPTSTQVATDTTKVDVENDDQNQGAATKDAQNVEAAKDPQNEKADAEKDAQTKQDSEGDARCGEAAVDEVKVAEALVRQQEESTEISADVKGEGSQAEVQQEAAAAGVEAAPMEVEAPQVDAQAVAKPATRKSSSGRAKVSKGSSLDASTFKIKRLQAEADEAEASFAVRAGQLEEAEARVAAIKADLASRRADIDAKRAASQKASQEYVRKQCEAAVAKLESDVPKRAPNMFIMFANDHREPGIPTHEQNTKMKEMWSKLTPEEKQPYKKKYEAGMKLFLEWAESEEGQKNTSERKELLAKIKASAKDELGEALAVEEAAPPAQVSPAKRTKASDEAKDTVQDSLETPAKQRRTSIPKALAFPSKPVLDEKVTEAAGKADMLVALQNLAARPEVMALGKSSEELLDALKASSGMVNAAKRVLLGA